MSTYTQPKVLNFVERGEKKKKKAFIHFLTLQNLMVQ